jgi:hypothetical protein
LRAQAARAVHAAAQSVTEDDAAAEVARLSPTKLSARTPKRVVVAIPKRVVNGGGPVGRTQTVLATAVQADIDADWKEF